MKKIIITLVVLMVAVAFSTQQVYAGSKQRHRWEGVAIGLGAAILGSAIIHSHHRAYYEPAPPRYHHRPRARWDHDYPAPQRPRAGHWEITKEWVPPTYERVWNPGHYDRNKRWIPGRWIKVVAEPGYWVEKKVWVPY